ncbi:MAG: glycosyltransferase [Planctomycetota bacterium]|jgi:glycosyltransferase involved in cell wall biosynthesis
MKIVHYVCGMKLAAGGVVRAVLDMCEGVAARGHEVTLLTLDPGDVPPSWRVGETGVPRVAQIERGALPRLNRSGLAQAQRQIKAADVVHLHGIWDPICLQLARLARRSDVPYVVSVHGMLDDWSIGQRTAKKRLYVALAGRRFLERAAAVHCTADAERAQSSKWYPRGRPVVIPYVTDLSPFLELPGPQLARRSFPEVFSDDGRSVILFLSRIHPKKGLEQLIRAAAELQRRGLEIAVAVAGTGEPEYEQSLRRLADEEGVSERLHFLGLVVGEQKVSLYEAADLFVLPTSQENWGLVLTESLACGTPVVTTRGVDIWSELEASGAAAIIDSAPEAIASAVAELLDDTARLRAMQQKGRTWVLEHLDADRVAGQYERLYRSVSGRAC